MLNKIKNKSYNLLRQSEKYTKTDMIYLTKGGLWLSLGQIIAFISALLLTITFANLLPKETYGTYKYLISILALLSIPSLKKFGTAFIQSIARGYEGNFEEILWTKIKWGSLGSLASFILAFYYFIQNNYTLAISFCIIAIIVPFFNGFNFYISYLSGKKIFSKLTKYRSLSQISVTISVVISLFLTNNVLFILLTYLSSETITRLIALYLTKKKFPPNKEKDEGVIEYGKHLSFIELFKSIAEEADKILIYHYIGGAELAIYSIAISPIGQIKTFILNLKTLAFPKLSKAKTEVIKKTLLKKILKASLITIPIIVIYILLAPWLFSIFFPKYVDSAFLSQILAISIILVPSSLMSSALSAKKQIKSLYRLRILGSLGKLIIYFIAIKFYGLIGLVISRIIIDIYTTLLYKYYFNKISN
jgi:O-antigen/teichoic acid export membrane protein